jgi:hypothetical protein
MISAGERQIALAVVLLLAALVRPTQSNAFTFNFHVQDNTTAQPIQGAIISLSGPLPAQLNQTTNVAGNTTVTLPPGSYTITVSKSQCDQIGPQSFIVDQTAPLNITVELSCQQSGSPPLENPSVQTDKSQYHYREIISWRTSGFAPGAYVQACLSSVCGGIIQSDSSGNARGAFLVDQPLSSGQTFSVKNVNTGASGQITVTIMP